MSIIPSEIIEEVRERADIVEVISEYVDLKRVGSNFKALCPFHVEKTPSFIVSRDKQIFHCFGCGIGGNVFSFLMKIEGISFFEAVKRVANRYGIEIKVGKAFEKKRYFELNRFCASFFHRMLFESKDGKIAREYLKKRGIEEDIIEKFMIGYAPKFGDPLYKALTKEGFRIDDAFELGLISKRGTVFHDTFRGRVILPIFDPSSEILGFGGRSLSGEPKYINSKESILYHKGKNFYGINFAKKHAREKGRICVVEGYFDLLSMFKAGVEETVATLGTALTPYQAALLKSLSCEVILIFDGDNAGYNGAKRALKVLVQKGVFPKLTFLDKGVDPDTYVRSGGDPNSLIEKSKPALEMFIDDTLKDYEKKQPAEKKRLLKDALSLIEDIPDKIDFEIYLEHISKRTGVNKEALKKREGAKETKNVVAISKKHPLEELFVKLLLNNPSFREFFDLDILDCFEDEDLKKITESFLSFGGDNLSKFLDNIEEELKSRVCQLTFSSFSIPEAEKVFSLCLKKFKYKSLKEKMRDISRRIKEAQLKNDKISLKNLLLEKQIILDKQREYLREVGIDV